MAVCVTRWQVCLMFHLLNALLALPTVFGFSEIITHECSVKAKIKKREQELTSALGRTSIKRSGSNGEHDDLHFSLVRTYFIHSNLGSSCTPFISLCFSESSDNQLNFSGAGDAERQLNSAVTAASHQSSTSALLRLPSLLL